MKKQTTQLTINDIAEYAGVSKSSVSCVLNGRSKVSKETRERILATIKKYNFEPRGSARALSTRKNYQMGFIISSTATLGIANSYFSQILDNVQSTFQNFGYHTLVATYDAEKMTEFLVPKNLQQNCFDGIIVAGQTSPLALKKLQNSGIPFIVIGGEEYPEDIISLRVNMLDSYVNLLKYLIGLGHHKLCFGSFFSEVHNLFMKSVNKFKTDSNEFIEIQHELFSGENEFSDGFNTAMKWLQTSTDKRYSTFIGSDQSCSGFLACLNENDVKCPDEISLVASCDSQLSQWNSIPLTSLTPQVIRHGKLAASLLIDIVENNKTIQQVKSETQKEYQPCEITVRKSTKIFEVK